MKFAENRKRFLALAGICIVLAVFTAGFFVAGRLDFYLSGSDYVGCEDTEKAAFVEGEYYYKVEHSGIWKGTPGKEHCRVLHTFWEDTWDVNPYGVYYIQGHTLGVMPHETGERQMLYEADPSFCKRMDMDLMTDGNVLLTLENTDNRLRTRMILDGRSGEVLETVEEKYNYANTEYEIYRIGNRVLECRRTVTGSDYDLLENGVSILPENTSVKYQNAEKIGDAIWFYTSSDYSEVYVVRADGRDNLLQRPQGWYIGESAAGDYVFYNTDEFAHIYCLDTTTGRRWEMEADSDINVGQVITDGNYMVTFYKQGRALWKIAKNADGVPIGMELMDEDFYRV